MSKVFRWTLSVLPLLIIGGLLYAAIFIKPKVDAGTVVQPAIDRGEYVYGVAPLQDAAILGVGSGGKIWRISADGQSFVSENSPTTVTLQDVSTWTDGAAVAVGDGGTVLVSRDQGRSWSTVKVALSP